jgi:hypothetical protein
MLMNVAWLTVTDVRKSVLFEGGRMMQMPPELQLEADIIRSAELC